MAWKDANAQKEYARRWYHLNLDREREKRRIYREANRDKKRIQAKKWYAEHIVEERARAHRRDPEKERQRNRRRYRADPEKKRKQNLLWHKNNPEKSKQISANWKKNNRERTRVHWHTRQARTRNNGGVWTYEEWLLLKQKYENKCLACGASEDELAGSGRILVPDHIIPISKDGPNEIVNLQPLCHGPNGCNLKKGVRTIDYRLIS